MEEDEISMSKKAKTIAACAVCAAALGLGGYALFANKETDTVPKFSEVTETAELTSEDVGVLPLGGTGALSDRTCPPNRPDGAG